ncbi:hypothetical protein L873DRAFT_1922975, partial [Choiromyces venosus 120613-1]
LKTFVIIYIEHHYEAGLVLALYLNGCQNGFNQGLNLNTRVPIICFSLMAIILILILPLYNLLLLIVLLSSSYLLI